MVIPLGAPEVADLVDHRLELVVHCLWLLSFVEDKLKRPDPLGLKCDTITSPRRLVNTFIHQMIPDLLK
jgi:hypothetical protein